MSVINFGQSVSLNEFANAIGTVGKEVTIIGQGEPGIGKSSMLKVLATRYPDYEVAYIDCTLLDLGDFALPYTESAGDMRVTKFAPNARFKMHSDKPVIVMLDEIGKAMKAVKNVLLTLMLEHRIGDHYLPEGSIVFATTNLAQEGIGDMIPPHARNRMCVVKIRKPNADEWIDGYALDNGILPEVILAVKQFPQMFQSFEDLQDPKDNEYIYDPRLPRPSFVTPRSMDKASDLLKKTKGMKDDVISHALIGTIGTRATYDMMAMVKLAQDLPDWETIIKKPTEAHVPDSPSAVCMLVYSAIQQVEKDNINKWVEYMNRLPKEAQGLFATSVMRTSKKTTVGTSQGFIKWATANNYLFAQSN